MNAITKKTSSWNAILGLVEERLSPDVFESWFRPIEFKGTDHENNLIHLRAGRVTADWVSLYYSDLVEKCLSQIGLDGSSVREADREMFIDN